METGEHLRRQHERDEPAAALVGVRAPQGLGVVPEAAALRHRGYLRRPAAHAASAPPSSPAQPRRRAAARTASAAPRRPHNLSGARQPQQPQRRPAARTATAAPGSPHNLSGAQQPAQPQRRVWQPACVRQGAAKKCDSAHRRPNTGPHSTATTGAPAPTCMPAPARRRAPRASPGAACSGRAGARLGERVGAPGPVAAEQLLAVAVGKRA